MSEGGAFSNCASSKKRDKTAAGKEPSRSLIPLLLFLRNPHARAHNQPQNVCAALTKFKECVWKGRAKSGGGATFRKWKPIRSSVGFDSEGGG